MLVADVVGGGIWEFVSDMDGLVLQNKWRSDLQSRILKKGRIFFYRQEAGLLCPLIFVIPCTISEISLSLIQLRVNSFYKFALVCYLGLFIFHYIFQVSLLLKYCVFIMCCIITNLRLGYFLTLKTIVLGIVLLAFNSNWLMCCIMSSGDVGWCYWCALWWSVHILCNERILGRDFKYDTWHIIYIYIFPPTKINVLTLIMSIIKSFVFLYVKQARKKKNTHTHTHTKTSCSQCMLLIRHINIHNFSNWGKECNSLLLAK